MQKPPQPFYIPLGRRRFLKSLALASAGFTVPGYLAEALTLTPQLTQGPFYPLAMNLPLDDDNDLALYSGSITAALGIVTYLSGRVLDSSGNPIKNALVEIWHTDDNGNYIYSNSAPRNPSADPGFQGFGQFLTASSGGYLFRTIKAGLYTGRTRHFHLGVTLPGQLHRFTTQVFWNETAFDHNGNPWPTQNSNDMVLQGITDPVQRASIILDYVPVPGTATGEVQSTYDIAMGLTPVEPTYPGGGSLLTQGALVPGPAGGNPRFQLTFPTYTGYTYEVYGDPTLADLTWKALPFSLEQTGAIDRNRYTATADGSLNIYVEEEALKDFYKVSFRVPGANIGTP
jgi:protocatechuate 3,4-dioxygenase, beta subunit